MEEWKQYKLSDICDLIAGFAFKSVDFGTEGVSVIKIKDIQPPFVNLDDADKVNLSAYDTAKLKKFLISKGDFLLAMTGATIGKIGKYISNEQSYLNQRVLKFQPKEQVDSKFVYYSLLANAFQLYILNHIDSDSAQPNISANTIGKYELSIPCIETQKRIVDILSSLDSKIELNRRINDNLEQQAQALFKAWFVDFEPFKDGNFVDSELGRIPEGWQVGQLDELIEIKYGKDHKKLLSGNIPVYGSGGIMRYVNMPIYEKESVLIPRKGSLNNVLYVNHPFWTVDTMFYTRMKINGIAKFIYLFISPIDLLSMNSGSAVPSMTTDILSKIRLVIPPKNIFDNFESLIAPFFEKIDSCNKEIYKLSNLRDALLPKLMSGELSINTITE